MSLSAPPPKWAADELTKFIDAARGNVFATFANRNVEVHLLIDIEAAMRLLVTNLDNSRDWFAALFLLRAHSAWLVAAQLAMSAQAIEAMVMLRASLESALYGFHIARNPPLKEVWLRRGEGEKERREMRKTFNIGDLIKGLAFVDQREANAAKTLYEQCIDYGAHPNEAGHMANLKMIKGEEETRFEVAYMNADPSVLAFALKTTARVGVCILGMYKKIFQEKYDILGISAHLPSLQRGL